METGQIRSTPAHMEVVAHVTTDLASTLVGMSPSSLQGAPHERARIILLDTIGVMCGGAARAPSAAAIRSSAKAIGGEGSATLVGSNVTSSVSWAALVNGVAAHALEMDDAHKFATGYHPAATVVPAALAVAEQHNIDLEDLLTAICVGYEAGGRIGRAVNPEHRYRGFHSTGTVGVFGAAAATAHLQRFDVDELTSALGVAGSMSSGIFAFLDGGHPTKHLHAGHAAFAGVMATDLVRQGFTGPPRFLEGRDGFIAVYAEQTDPTAIASDNGEHPEVLNSYFKLWPACGHSYSVIEAALTLEKNLQAGDEITSACVETYRAAAVLDEREPRTLSQAQFSLPFLAALVLRGYQITIENVITALDDPTVRELTQLIEIVEDPAMSREFPARRVARVSVVTNSGRREVHQVDTPPGFGERPVATEPLVEKFRSIMVPLVGDEAALHIENLVLAGNPPVRELLNLLRFIPI